MIYSENQNRQFYVVNSAPTAKKAFDKFYVELADENVSTDKISKGMIRDVRISKPDGPALKQWVITMPSSIVSDEDYFINMEFKNWMGFGNNDNYLKFAVAHSTSDSAATLATKLADNLKKSFSREAIKPFSFIEANYGDGTVGGITGTATTDDTVKSVKVTVQSASTNAAVAGSLNTTTGVLTISITPSSTSSNNTVAAFNTAAAAATITNLSSKEVSDYYTVTNVGTISQDTTGATIATVGTITLRERDEQVRTKDAIIRGITRLPINLEIGLDTTAADGWAASNVAVSTWKTYSNAEVIADMEYFFMKGRADMYGYMGFPNINPTDMKVDPSGSSDYYVLDIKYYFQEHGMLNQNSEKEMTFVSTDVTILTGITDNNIVSGWTNEAGTSKTPGTDSISRVFLGTVSF